jgi:hypothetical protein
MNFWSTVTPGNVHRTCVAEMRVADAHVEPRPAEPCVTLTVTAVDVEPKPEPFKVTTVAVLDGTDVGVTLDTEGDSELNVYERPAVAARPLIETMNECTTFDDVAETTDDDAIVHLTLVDDTHAALLHVYPVPDNPCVTVTADDEDPKLEPVMVTGVSVSTAPNDGETDARTGFVFEKNVTTVEAGAGVGDVVVITVIVWSVPLEGFIATSTVNDSAMSDDTADPPVFRIRVLVESS